MAKIKESVRELMATITNLLSSEATKRSRKNQPRVRALVKYELYNAIYECPEMESVRSGKLKYDFGLDHDPTAQIADAVSSAFKMSYPKNPGNIFGFNIEIQPLSYFNVLDLPGSFQITEHGEELPWLDWLLTYGSTVVIIDNYGVKYANAGRSGGAQMIEGYNYGRGFMVDPQFSGTYADNFVTRAISAHKANIISAAYSILEP
jgi:hypothetical protein